MAKKGRVMPAVGSVAGSSRFRFQMSRISHGSRAVRASRVSSPPRLTFCRYSPKLMPMELPTRKVAGSPTSVSRPAVLLTMAVRIIGGTMSMSSSRATRMMTGASSTTVVALGSTAHSAPTRMTRPIRKRLPLPRVKRR